MKVFFILLLMCCVNCYSQQKNSSLVFCILNNKEVINDSKLEKCDTIEVIYKSVGIKGINEYLINGKVFKIKPYTNELENGIEVLQKNIDYSDKLYYCKKIFVIETILNKKRTTIEVFNPSTGSFITISFKLKRTNFVQKKYFVGSI